MTKVLIAAAWPYASGPRHLGHAAGAYLPADVVARYHRLADDDVLFVTEGEDRSAFCPDEGRSLPDRYVQGRCPHCGQTDARGDQCDGCGSTLDPDDLLDPTCRRCGAAAVFRPLRQLFLRLDLLQPH